MAYNNKENRGREKKKRYNHSDQEEQSLQAPQYSFGLLFFWGKTHVGMILYIWWFQIANPGSAYNMRVCYKRKNYICVSVETCLILQHFKWETMREVSLLHRFLIDRSKLLVFNNVFIITLKVLILACIKALVLFESICVAWFCQLCVANWQIQTDSEELLIIKTRQSLLEALTEHVKTNHEYE